MVAKLRSLDQYQILMLISTPIALLLSIYGLIVLVSYSLEIEVFHRPILGGPATHPLTALVIFLMSYSILVKYFTEEKYFQLALLSFSMLMLCLRLIDEVMGTQLHLFITPYLDYSSVEPPGQAHIFGLNTAISLLCINLGLFTYLFNKILWGQILVFLALFFPSLALVGFAYELPELYGQMSLMSLVLIQGLVFSVSCIHSDQGIVKSMLSFHIGARLSWCQIVSIILVPLILGTLFISTIEQSGAKNIFGIYVVCSFWISFLMIIVSLIIYENKESSRAVLEKTLIKLANTDSLTQLSNRRHFFEQAEHEFLRSERTNHPIWVFMIDVDNFKAVNDHAGHEVGDLVINEIARVLKSSLRDVDIIGRLGGEEFAVVLSDVDNSENSVQRIAELLRQNVAKINIKEVPGLLKPHTISIGVATSLHAIDFKSTLRLADEQLYQAKQQGKNQVMVNNNLASEFA